MIEQLLLIYVVSALCFFGWQVWVYLTCEHLKLQINNRDKTIGSLKDANKFLNSVITENQKSIRDLKNIIQTNKIGEAVAKKTAKSKTKKPMKK